MNNTKILILEDHPLTRRMLILALQQLGYTKIYPAECGEQALAMLKVEKYFDVLICDIQMPGMDGLTFLGAASEVGRIATLILSSSIAADIRVTIQQLARLDGYQVLGDLEKPFSCDTLKDLMCRFETRIVPRSQRPNKHLLSATEIRRGLANGEFIPFFQPKLNLLTMEVIGAEVLVRWKHPVHGLLAPQAFIQVVKQLGLLNAMTYSIARQSFRFLRELNLIGDISLSINLETEQLALPALLEAVRKALDAERVPAQSLILEITETGVMQASITCLENMVRLRLFGCGISIDDFGTGHSSLQRICEMPCSELKLDASFIHDMNLASRSLAIVENLPRLANKIGVQLVAEGIETHEQLIHLQHLGYTIGQGYLFSRPLSGTAFMPWLIQHRLSLVSLDGD